MARSTNGTSDTTAAKKNPVRRTAPASRTSRKAQVEAVDVAGGRPADEAADSNGAESNGVRDEIARRAFELYLRRGSRNGHDIDDWLEAERQLRGSGSR